MDLTAHCHLFSNFEVMCWSIRRVPRGVGMCQTHSRLFRCLISLFSKFADSEMLASVRCYQERSRLLVGWLRRDRKTNDDCQSRSFRRYVYFCIVFYATMPSGIFRIG